ncbi:aminotransferase class I/II-fold pyridoxal phosphate-dependent enzyme [Luteolibacter sp. AS25]|uniref:aminotransferase class I/II-fold pyridoxal phosphate-dependent enzyme n=1 Tax=Luteolibacter sp. AS25 TaxID=3135776 RepID=UPI00398B7DF8
MSGINPSEELAALKSSKLHRQLRTVDSNSGTRISIAGEELWNFSSNDYLGLASHPKITGAFIEGIQRYGAGSTASRLVIGTSSPHTLLEETIACSKQSEAALTFTSGFATALSAIPTIVGKGDFVFLDKLSHASLIDASRASGATLRVFPHNDHLELDRLLKRARQRSTSRILVATESVFSMDGDLCPLEEILEVCETHGAELLLDEAHAIGVLGKKGMGLAEQLGVQSRVHFQMGTLSKAIGLSGGYLAASREWVDLITNRARAFIYTTAPPPAIAHAARAAFELIRSEDGSDLRERLFRNIAILRANHPSAILPIILGDNETALATSESLREKGFLIPAIRFPTVPKGTARLRLTISALHTEEIVREISDLLPSGI